MLYLIFFLKFCDHDNNGSFNMPDSSPEVNNGVWHGTLRSNESLFLTYITLVTNENTYSTFCDSSNTQYIINQRAVKKI